HQVARLAGSGRLSGRIRIPGAVGLLEVVADLRASQVICHMDVEAPREGRPVTRVKWLLRQLRRAPDSVRLEAFASHSRGPGNSELLRDVRVTPSLLVAGHRRELRSFRVAAIYPMGSKRGIGRNSFIDSVLTAVDSFHRDVVKELKAWSAPAPRKDNATSGASEDPLAGSSMGTEDPREGCLQARAIDTAGSSISSTAEQGAGAGHDVAQVPAQRCGPTPIPEAVDAEVAAAQ
ncbi:MAG: hypothetical protein JO285_04135, partial [Kutzneria sp.]|nr:hypothetical protein [Kutzneria sp.]